jgi:hypothetical protein
MNSPQERDNSGLFENNGFMGRYARYVDNLDSSFCRIVTQQRDLLPISISNAEAVTSPVLSRSRTERSDLFLPSSPPAAPLVNFYQSQQPESYTEQLVSSFPDTSSISMGLFNISPTLPFGTGSQGNNQMNVGSYAAPVDFGQTHRTEEMNMDDPILNSLQTLAEAGESLEEPQNFNFNVWDWFASQEKNVQ